MIKLKTAAAAATALEIIIRKINKLLNEKNYSNSSSTSPSTDNDQQF